MAKPNTKTPDEETLSELGFEELSVVDHRTAALELSVRCFSIENRMERDEIIKLAEDFRKFLDGESPDDEG